ncbi:lytic murein transglycosylase [Patescibacteria group bacterium]|nr:lytic murein transglycosylase [Patescibacteria group bacterium]
MKFKFVLSIILVVNFLFWPYLSALGQGSVTQQQLQVEQQRLEQELKEIEVQIEQYTKELGRTQSQKATLNNKIRELRIKQSSIALQIKQTTLQLQGTEKQINKTQGDIDINEQRLTGLHKEMAKIIRQLHITSQQNTVFNMFLYDKGISGFFDEIQTYKLLSDQLFSLLEHSKEEGLKLVDYKKNLENQREGQKNLISIANLQKNSLSQNISQQDNLLSQTKGQEAAYQQLLKDKKKKADEIRARIYELFGTTKRVTFGEAVQIAQWVSERTGVRAAFLLAVLTQESNLGKNVGTCNRASDPPEKGWRVIMKPTRDQEPFLQITKELGLDPDTTPVSCPMRDKQGKQIGWGGAMGPAQFIPSTWLGYRDKVAKITGRTANPWDIRDAFVAAGVKLGADGARQQSGEWTAAMKYFAGSVNPAYSFYGDSVVALANRYQDDIDSLNY